MSDTVVEQFLNSCKSVRTKIRLTFLFGSRARGSERPDSDYDLLLVVNEDFSLNERDILYDAVMDILLETGRLVSLKIFKESVFARLKGLNTPFIRHVLEEGVQIG